VIDRRVRFESTRGLLVQADARLVTVLGADDLVVIEAPDAVLAASIGLARPTRDAESMACVVAGSHTALVQGPGDLQFR
jgi:hypothetical protein